MCGLYPAGLEAALLEWKYRGALTGNLKMVVGGAVQWERTHLHRQTNTGKQIQTSEYRRANTPRC